MAEMARWQRTIVDNAGNILPSAQVTVTRESTGALATIYSGRTGGSKSNAFNADANGFAFFYAPGGAYRIDIVSGAFSQTLRYVAVGTSAESDVAGTGPPTGLVMTFDDPITDADPTQGKFRANHATFASVTKLWVDNLNTLGNDITPWLDALDDRGATAARGILRMELRSDVTAKWAEFLVTGSVVNKTGYRELTVTPLSQVAWPFTDEDSVTFNFAPAGQTGIASAASPAISMIFSTTTSDADPGTGKLRFNNATVASVTAIYIDNAEAGGGSITGWLDAFDDPDNLVRGFLYINKTTDPTKFALFKVTGLVVDGTGYRKLTVVHMASNSTFADTDPIQVMFVPSGNGTTAGLRWLFDSSTSMADPGSGDLRLNNATLASVTAIALSALVAESGNPSVLAFQNTWDDSGTTANRGLLTIKKVGAPENFAIYKITGTITDNTTWVQLAVTHVASAGSFAASDQLSVHFTPTGIQGGDMVLLASGTIANSATQLDIVLTGYTAYRRLVIFGSNWRPATDGVSLQALLSTDGGANYDVGVADYSWNSVANDDTRGAAGSAIVPDGDVSDALLSITGASATGLIGNGATEGVNFTTTIYNPPNTAAWPRIRSEGVLINNIATPACVQFQSVGTRRAAQDTDAIRFKWSAGNFNASAPGTWAIYGFN